MEPVTQGCENAQFQKPGAFLPEPGNATISSPVGYHDCLSASRLLLISPHSRSNGPPARIRCRADNCFLIVDGFLNAVKNAANR